MRVIGGGLSKRRASWILTALDTKILLVSVDMRLWVARLSANKSVLDTLVWDLDPLIVEEAALRRGELTQSGDWLEAGIRVRNYLQRHMDED